MTPQERLKEAIDSRVGEVVRLIVEIVGLQLADREAFAGDSGPQRRARRAPPQRKRKPGEAEKIVRDYLAKNGTACTAAHVAEATGLQLSTVHDRFAAMRKRGELRKHPAGGHVLIGPANGSATTPETPA